MAKITIELVLIEDDATGDELYVLDWEYDIAKNKVLYFKLTTIEDWLEDRHDQPAYIVREESLILYERDYSGNLSTSEESKFSDGDEGIYDIKGCLYRRPKKEITLKELHMRLIYLDTLEQLGQKEVVRRIKEGERFPESL
ncbi:MAG: hypothetical protein SWK76_17320 [Actinomycetota bacterium]|nr:hypothetical protein [Actinomycetota bacterium]